MDDILTPDQQTWLSARVENGEFPSIEEAARRLIDESIAGRDEIERDDLAWAKPYLDEALADIAHGGVLTREQYRSRLLASYPLKD